MNEKRQILLDIHREKLRLNRAERREWRATTAGTATMAAAGGMVANGAWSRLLALAAEGGYNSQLPPQIAAGNRKRYRCAPRLAIPSRLPTECGDCFAAPAIQDNLCADCWTRAARGKLRRRAND